MKYKQILKVDICRLNF